MDPFVLLICISRVHYLDFLDCLILAFMNFKIFLLLSLVLLLPSCTKKNFEQELSSSRFTESQELRLETQDSIFISGSLEFVNAHKLIIFIAGSGPTDRDCNNVAGLKTDAFKMLATYLKEEGISSFRYDKRGIGESSKVDESSLDFHSFVNDAEEIVKYFASDFNQIILLGHSEGALIGSMVSVHESVHSFISVSGTSKNLDQIVLDQMTQYPKLVPLAEKHINEIKNGEELSEVHPMLLSLFRPSVVPYLKSLFAINPTAELAKVQKPVLIVNGTCDIQVPADHAEQLHKVSGNSKLVIIENMGHAMKELEDDCANAMDAYTKPEIALNVQFKSALLDFLK